MPASIHFPLVPVIGAALSIHAHLPLLAQSTAPPAGQLAITNVTVIDATGAAPRPGSTLLVREGRIAALGPGATVRVPTDARVVDGRGKFLIPGLWDAHAHFYHGDRALAQFVAHGVTSVEHMWAFRPDVIRWREAIARGSRIGPAILAIAGEWPDSGNVADIPRLIDSLGAAGATFLKIGSAHPIAWMRATAAAARRRGMPMVGHAPWTLRPSELFALEPSRIEHVSTHLLLAVSSREGELFPAWVTASQAGDRGRVAAITLQAIEAFSESRLAALARDMVQRGIAITPTLVNHRMADMASDSNFAADPRLTTLQDTAARNWAAWIARQRLAPDEARRARQIYDAQVRLVGALKRAGVRVLAGSDVGDHYRYYGSSLHDELELLVSAGLSPMEALQAATREPAAHLRALSERGTVEAGKVADLVLLDANPLDDIRNVRRVHTVVLRGQPIRPNELIERR